MTQTISFNYTADFTVSQHSVDSRVVETKSSSLPVFVSGSFRNDRIIGVIDASNELYGNDGNDTLIGGRYNDHLFGGAGRDTLTGGRGADGFHFNQSPQIGMVDRITDYYLSEGDYLIFYKSSFPGATQTLTRTENTNLLSKSLRTSSSFVYDRETGNLYWNQNGTQPGFGSGGLVATFSRISTGFYPILASHSIIVS